ncbi:MAG: hypothetical protein EOP53_10380 [Sphingobacteriales bacterium]|nr:MAG: hypothetical protein EOP53_10380 [Sphingobacteriales bacterium]
MRHGFICFSALAAIFLFACKKTPDPVIQPDNTPKLEGGKGGNFDRAFFSVLNGKGVSSRMFLKYAADKMPSDTTLYDERGNTITEPGFGPHFHFEDLKKGTYFLHIKSATAQADTTFFLTDSSAEDMDIKINLR